jgi:hypothetical protein
MLISMILNIIKMEIWKSGKLLDNEVTRFSKQKYRHPFKFEFQIGHKIFAIYLYKNIVSYLKFRLNFPSYVLNGCAGNVTVEVVARVKKAHARTEWLEHSRGCKKGDLCETHTAESVCLRPSDKSHLLWKPYNLRQPLESRVVL